MTKKKDKKGKAAKAGKGMSFLKPLDTKDNIKNTIIETGKSVVIGLVGAGIGAAIGKPSLALGLATTGVGHYRNSKMLTSLGVGMMASGSYQIGASAVSGTDVGGLEGAKERIKAFGSDIKHRLYIDKFIKSKSKDETTNGMGEVQYFKYPKNELDMGSLENIENEIARSGERFEQRQMSGSEDDFQGVDEKIY
jgi:hypothetical protein